MASPKLQDHKVKKGDTLEGIAKKYGHRDWKVIWNAPENKKVVRKRREPKSIQAGDILVIPLNDKQKKELQAQAELLQEGRDAETCLLKALADETARTDKKIKHYESLIKSQLDSTKKIVEELKKNLGGMKNWATGVDVVAVLTQMGVNLGKLASTGHQASQATGDVLKALNDQALKQAGEIVKSPIKGEAIKAAGRLKEDKSTTLAVVGILADSWNKMTSPSFWAHTYVQMTENGKSWSEAVTTNIGDDIKKRIKDLVTRTASTIKELEKLKKVEENQKKTLASDITTTKQRIKEIESELSELPPVQ